MARPELIKKKFADDVAAPEKGDWEQQQLPSWIKTTNIFLLEIFAVYGFACISFSLFPHNHAT